MSRPAFGRPQAVDGRTTAITTMTPMKPFATLLERLVLFAGEHIRMMNEGLVKLAFIHYARWTIVTDIPFNGPPQQREDLQYDYLFFETNFNGTWDEYIDAFSEVIPDRMSQIWGSSFGFPGPQPVGPFKDYIHKNDLPISHYYGAYPGATTKTVLAALAVRDELADFVAVAESEADPETFRRAWDAFLTDIQHNL